MKSKLKSIQRAAVLYKNVKYKSTENDFPELGCGAFSKISQINNCGRKVESLLLLSLMVYTELLLMPTKAKLDNAFTNLNIFGEVIPFYEVNR